PAARPRHPASRRLRYGRSTRARRGRDPAQAECTTARAARGVREGLRRRRPSAQQELSRQGQVHSRMTQRRRRIAEVGEHRWLRELLGALRRDGTGVWIGPGDDAAVLRPERRPWVVTTDAQRAGVHFRPGWWSWRDLGRRAFLASASDVAAMGEAPRAALLALEVPPRFDVAALSV